MFNLLSKNILIFGGTGELMGNIAISLHQSCANVIVIGRTLKKNKLNDLIESNKIDFIKFDILNDNVEKLFKTIYEKYKYIDMIINGAGINSDTRFLDIKQDEIDNIFKVNFSFVVKCCQLYIDNTLKLDKPGKILNIGSVSALNPLSKVFMYSASKAALHNLSKNLAREYGNRNITTNILVPGFFPAEQNKNILSKSRVNNIMKLTPMNRFGKPEELFSMVNMLASDGSSFLNGSELVIDGGYSITKI